MTQYTNRFGQTISVGDRVVYVGYRWGTYIGKFLGLTPAEQVRIEVEGGKPALKNRYTGKIHYYYNNECWDRRPFSHYRHKETGELLHTSEFGKIPYSERQIWDYDKGVLNSSFVEITVPRIYNGVKGLDRTFKL